MRTETGLAQIVGNAVLNGGGIEAADEYLPAMRKVTRDDLIRIGRQYFQPQKATLAHMLPLESKVRRKKAKAAAVAATETVEDIETMTTVAATEPADTAERIGAMAAHPPSDTNAQVPAPRSAYSASSRYAGR